MSSLRARKEEQPRERESGIGGADYGAPPLRLQAPLDCIDQSINLPSAKRDTSDCLFLVTVKRGPVKHSEYTQRERKSEEERRRRRRRANKGAFSLSSIESSVSRLKSDSMERRGSRFFQPPPPFFPALSSAPRPALFLLSSPCFSRTQKEEAVPRRNKVDIKRKTKGIKGTILMFLFSLSFLSEPPQPRLSLSLYHSTSLHRA